MREPKTITVKTQSGESRRYVISKFPAIAGREIVTQYPITGTPKIGEYQANKEIMLKLMSFVEAETDSGTIALTTSALVDNHVPDWETLGKIEVAMLEYNCSFFQNGKVSTFFDALRQKVEELITGTLTGSLAQLYQAVKQPTENSETNTH